MIEYFNSYPLIGALILLLSVLWAKASIYLVKKHHTLDSELITKLIPLSRGTFKQKLKLKILVLLIAVIGIYLILIIDFTSYEKLIADFIVNLTFASVIYWCLFFLMLLINTYIINNGTSEFRALRNSYLMFIFVCTIGLLPLAIFTNIINYFFVIFNLLLGIIGYRELNTIKVFRV
ncbi:hypothetical protein [Tenuibacillus multivorans]|uniref:Uncharacterized protein n=1 Tax=Tenuibacillus multivorans TaxID=237069 RepID=A0A1H0DHQ0_9BACI|nr:hypothetical protein [Tenuibacillus multivorans]GEL76550.1 hypothetical protein TMU01_07850 [Tenuibacillus multivorans]SDN69598.1 hypothetical protein SAMN05216498_2876 [Tenuibacillus multivorans]